MLEGEGKDFAPDGMRKKEEGEGPTGRFLEKVGRVARGLPISPAVRKRREG